jgi:hypothetical protein
LNFEGAKYLTTIQGCFPNKLWTKLSSIGFILAHPHFPKLHIFKKLMLINFSLTTDLVASFPHIWQKGIGFGCPWGSLA